jgi:hypothetical protein
LAVLNGPAPNNGSIVGDRAQRVCRFDKTAILFGDFRAFEFRDFAKLKIEFLAIFNIVCDPQFDHVGAPRLARPGSASPGSVEPTSSSQSIRTTIPRAVLDRLGMVANAHRSRATMYG